MSGWAFLGIGIVIGGIVVALVGAILFAWYLAQWLP
jgi:hypothetical protein